MINGRNEQKQDASQAPSDARIARAIDRFVQNVQEAKAGKLHGSLRLLIGFQGGVPANVEFDKHESMR